MSAIKEIMRFQSDRLLDKQPFDDLNELTNIVEEMIELWGYDVPKEQRDDLKQRWKLFIEYLISVMKLKRTNNDGKVDALNDIIVFCIGGIMKLGYNPECTLNEVAKHINSRVGSIINGKFEKDMSKKHLWYEVNYERCKNEQ
jgi:predicted HAD superfamily Cof-like phosphohydrolase